MPELPEVEIIVRDLRSVLVGQNIVGLNLSSKLSDIERKLSSTVLNQTITEVNRLAKYILIKLKNSFYLVIHLGMSGRLRLEKNVTPNKHDHVIFILSDLQKLVFNDPRRFGFITVLSEKEQSTFMQKLGIEPLTKAFTGKYLYQLLSSRSKGNIKSLLMDMRVIAGIGNIYACESLFLAGIAPDRTPNTISKEEALKLEKAIKEVLLIAINAKGSSFKDYTHTDGNLGSFQNSFKLYQREGKACYNCDSAIKRTKISGRSSFYCPRCQK